MKKISNISKIVILLLIVLVLSSCILIYNNVIPKELTNNEKIENVIFMIGDGMGENHILATEIFKGEKLNIQTIPNYTYVTTHSTEEVTDSAAAATALATGVKTNNGLIGKDVSGNDVENLIEFASKNGLKTGVVCTQILNHATPAGFTVHNYSRNNYEEIAISQINSCTDLMLGGGQKYFSSHQNLMEINNREWITDFSLLQNIDKNSKVIGTFAYESISNENNRVALSDLTKSALNILENDNGFFLMIEGSDIDIYSHAGDISRMMVEMLDFDAAIKVAKKYVDEHPNTLLIVTADHETGGLTLENVTNKNDLKDTLYTSNGAHTSTNVMAYAYGKGAKALSNHKLIDNTDIYNFVKQGLINKYSK